MGAYDDLLAAVPAKKSGAYDDLLLEVEKPEPSLKDKIYKAANKLFQPSSVIDEANISTQPTGFDNAGAVKRVIQDNAIPNNLRAGARIVDGLTGIAEVGGRKGYAWLGRIEAGAIKVLADVLGSETLSNVAKSQQDYANQVENGAVLRGKLIEGFAKESIVQDLPGASANAISSIITTAPSLAAGVIAPELTFPAMFATAGSQEYGQGRESGLNPAGAALRAIPQAALEVIGEKVGGTGQLAEALHAAAKGNGLANLGSAMVGSAIKELPGEELTATGNFLVDKAPGIGLNQKAGISDYGKQVKDTALATLLQSGAMAGGGHVLNTTAGSTQSAPVINEAAPEVVQNNQFDATATLDALNQARELVKPRLEISSGTQADDALAAQKQAEHDAQTTRATPTYTELLAQPAEPNNAEENTQGGAGDIPAPVADKPNRTLKQKSGSLLATLRDLGGVSINDKLDVTGEDKAFAPGGYNQIFRNNSRQSLKGHIESGTLDDYLPPAMRLSSQAQSSDAFDSTEAYNYLADKIRNGERVLKFDVEQEVKANKFYQDDSADVQSDIINDVLSDDEVNALLSEAGHDEREANTQARIFEQRESDSDIAGNEGIQAREGAGRGGQTQADEVTRSEVSGARDVITQIVKRRAAANQIGKSKPFDTALQLAKNFMNGEKVSPIKFKNAAILFKNDAPLSEAFNKLHEQAKAPARERRAARNDAVDAYTRIIEQAESAKELHQIAGDIQDDKSLTDAQAQALDDAVMDAIDAIISESEQESEISNDVISEKKNLNTITIEQARKEASKYPTADNYAFVANRKYGISRKDATKIWEEANADLLGDNTVAKQAIADAERTKDEKRNAGNDNASEFNLSGSNSEADKAIAAGARPLFSLSNSTKQAYEKRVDDLFSGAPANREGAKVLDKSDVLDMLGYGGKPVVLAEGKVIAGQTNHKLTAEHWKRVPDWLDSPAAVFDSDTVSGSLVFIAPESFKGAPIRMIVVPNAKENNIKIHMLANAYDAQINTPTTRWVRDGLLRYIDKQKSRDFLTTSRLQLPRVLQEARSSGRRILVDSDLVKYRAENNAKLSRDTTKQNGMPKADVQSIVDDLTVKWKNAPQIIVVDDMNDTAIREAVRAENERQLSQGAEGQPEGFFDAGKVYVVASEMATADDVQRVIFHEALGHFGLQGTFGNALNDVLDKLYELRRAEVLKKVKQYGLDLTNQKDRRIAAEEVLAEMAQNNPEIGFVKRAIAAIRQWLRDNGFNVKLSNSDIAANYLLPARYFVQNGLKAQSSSAILPAFHRAWHGSPHDHEKFDMSKVGTGEGNQAYGFGLYFAGSKNVAEWYKDNLSRGLLLDGKPLDPMMLDEYRDNPAGKLAFRTLLGNSSDGSKSAYSDTIEWLEKNITNAASESDIELNKDALKIVKSIKGRISSNTGKMYQVELTPKENEYLLWDKPLSEQSDAVKTSLESLIFEYEDLGLGGDLRDSLNQNETGDSFYRLLTSTVGSDKNASKDLHRNGIRGIKYLDGTSRNQHVEQIEAKIRVAERRISYAKELSNDEMVVTWEKNLAEAKQEFDALNYNYVIFNDEDVNIEAKFSRGAQGNGGTKKALTLFRRDALGNIQLAPTGKAYDFISNITQNIANQANFGMASPELRKQIRHFKADMQKALDVAGNVAHGMQKMTPEDRSLVSDVVENMLKTGTVPPRHVLDVAANMQSIMDTQTDELVKLGMLNKDAAERWRGKYLPRFYNREQDPALSTFGQKLLRTALPIRGLGGGSLKGRGLYKEINVRELDSWEALGWEVRDTLWKKNRQGKLELIDPNNVRENETVMIWRDYTPAERESMGENRDAMFRFVMGYTAMQNDIALGRLFDGIASNQEWTRSRPSEGYTKVPDSEIAETGGVKKYGNLAGLYVRDDIMQHISQYEQSSDLVKYYRKALSFWKAGKTVLNPVSHMNNMVSNLTMAHFAGVSYWETHKYIGAISDFVNNAPMIQEAKDVGLMTGDITRAELISEMPDDIKAMMNSQDSKITKSAKATYNVLTFGLTKPMSKAYRFEDDFFKYLIYKEARANGVSPDDAVDYATKYIFNYDDLPKTARLVRDAAIPFFAYTYKAVPALAYTAFNYPWRFAAPAAAIYGLNALAYGLIAGDDDDDLAERFAKGKELEAEERKNLPPWMQGKSALGTEKTIRLGTDEKTDLPIYMDISRFMPGGDMFDIAHGDFTTLPAPITPSNPVLTTIAALMPQINKDMFTGKDIVDKNDTPAEAAKKRAGWLMKQISPAIAPTGYHAEKLLNAGALMADTTINIPFVGFGDDVEYTGFGKDGLPVQPKYAAMNVLGIKAKPVDLKLSAEISQGQDNSEIKSIKAEIRQAARLLDKGAISQRAYDKTEAEGMQKIEDIINEQ